MAVQESVPISAYTASGASGVFAYGFQVLAEADMVALVEGVAASFSITGVGNPSGGSVTITPTPTAGQRVVLYRDSRLERTTDYQNNGDLIARVLNSDFDRIWLVLQEIVFSGKGLAVSVRAPAGETLDELPEAEDRASMLLGFDDDGQPFLYALGTAPERVAQTENQTATAAQTLFTLASVTYTPGLNSLMVFKNGLLLTRGADYVETSISTVTLLAGAEAGDELRFIGGTPLNATSSTDASTSAYTPSGTGAVDSNVQDALRRFIVVSDYSTVQEAIDRALATGLPLYWDGAYTITGALTNLHSVKHFGRGSLTRGSDTFYPAIKNGQTNTLYVAPSGTGDGLTAAYPLTLQGAITALENFGPMLDGSWIIRGAAGTYPGGALTGRNIQSRDFIKIIGPDVGGSPNVPTMVIDKSADAAQTIGIRTRDGTLFWLEDVKVSGALATGIEASRNVYLQLRNVHVDGPVIGVNVETNSRYFVYGGVYQNCSNMGFNELFNCVRSFVDGDRALIANCGTGFKAKEHGSGHLAGLDIEDCDVGFELNGHCVANVDGLGVRRNGCIGLLVNSEIHEEDDMVVGTGGDANTRGILPLGHSDELDASGWTGDETARTNHRPLRLLASDYSTASHTGTTSETTLASFASPILRAQRYDFKGKKWRVEINGRIPAAVTLAGDVRILLNCGATFMTDVTIPAAVVGAKPFRIVFEVVCTADGNFQHCAGWLVGDGFGDATTVARTVDMSTAKAVTVSAILADGADTVEIETTELHG